MYNVGDTIWIIMNDRPGVMPYNIVEEVTKKSISGTKIAYMVEIPGPPGKTKIKNLDSISGDRYTSIESAKKSLMARAEKAIDSMLDKGVALIKKWEITPIGETSTPLEKAENQLTINEDPLDEEYITLPDGSKAKINFKGDMP